jgi:hypothetical protein
MASPGDLIFFQCGNFTKSWVDLLATGVWVWCKDIMRPTFALLADLNNAKATAQGGTACGVKGARLSI